MKTIILSINSKYIHTLLAPRYLKANTENQDIEIIETNINVNINDVFEELYEKQPDVIAISCYIFNIEYVRRILLEIKNILPNVKIILGGYEAVFDSDRYVNSVDYIIKGEGDIVFGELLHDLKSQTYKFPKIVEAGIVCDLSIIKSPYTEEYCRLGDNRILYFETTRGCPYKCSYCMSANSKGVRSFSKEVVETNLKYIMQFSPKQIKFVDRTFNYDINRAIDIFKFLIENFNDKSTNFHFEMAPELFNDEMIEVLKAAKKDLFQFEIGIQTYNKTTLKNIGRNANVKKIELNLKKLLELNTINIHVDLIAGLPEEDLQSFISGFDRLIKIKPDCLQLGFLKMLKGSKLQKNSEGYTSFKTSPYEIINTPHLSYKDVLELKGVEDLLELYYNSGRFKKSIGYLIDCYQSPYILFKDLANFYKRLSFNRRNTQPKTQCDLLLDYITKIKSVDVAEVDCNFAKSLIAEDYYTSGNIREWYYKSYVD